MAGYYGAVAGVGRVIGREGETLATLDSRSTKLHRRALGNNVTCRNLTITAAGAALGADGDGTELSRRIATSFFLYATFTRFVPVALKGTCCSGVRRAPFLKWPSR
jgi:hypothetical protein